MPGDHAGFTPAEMVGAARRLGLRAEAFGAPEQAFGWIAGNPGADRAAPRILICGSLYLAGAILAEHS